MDERQRGPVLILVGIILVIIDFTVLYWFPSLILTYVGVCLCCSGICQTSQAKRRQTSGYQPYQPSPQFQPQPVQPLPTAAPQAEKAENTRFCPYCGSAATGKFCPECGQEID